MCLALVAATRVAVVRAAGRRGPGAHTLAHARALSSVAHASAQTAHGLMRAIPAAAWRVFSRRRPAERVATLREWAQKVRLKA